MNQAFSNLIAAQLGLPPINGDLQPAQLAALLAERSSDSKNATLFRQMADAFEAAPPEEQRTESSESDLARIEQLEALVRQMEERLAAADLMAHFISEKFGACKACWGLNQFCKVCGGRGKPGSAPPDIIELRAWVEPALRSGGFQIVPLRDNGARTP